MRYTHIYTRDLNAPEPDLSRIKIHGLPLNWRRVGLTGDTWTANSHFMGCYEVRKVPKKGWCWMNPSTKLYVQCLDLEAGQKASQMHQDNFTASQVVLSCHPEGIRVRMSVDYHLDFDFIEIESVSLHAEIDNPKHPISRYCTGELHPDNWHYLGGEEAIELECRNFGPHLEPDDDYWPNGYPDEVEEPRMSDEEEDFYSIQHHHNF